LLFTNKTANMEKGLPKYSNSQILKTSKSIKV